MAIQKTVVGYCENPYGIFNKEKKNIRYLSYGNSEKEDSIHNVFCKRNNER